MSAIVKSKWPPGPMVKVKPTKKKYPEKKREDLTLAHDLRFYNVEGEGTMRTYTDSSTTDESEVADQLRALDLTTRSDSIRRDTKNYQSWLASFAEFCNDPSLYRTEKHSVYTGNYKVKQKSVDVGKVRACFLIRADDPINGRDLEEDDSWGNHSTTARIYLDRMQRSQKEREKNDKDDGKLLSLVNVIPPDWDSNMSSQIPSEGYEHRARPPTVVELIRSYRGREKTPRSKLLFSIGKVGKSKLDKVKPPWSPAPVELGDLSNHGTAVNDPINIDLSGNGHLFGPFKNEASSTRYKYPNFRRKVVSLELSLLGEFNSPEETARYLSWLRAPEVMRLALYYDRDNYIRPSSEDIEKLDLLQEKYFYPKQYQFWQDYWTEDSTDDIKYQLWLLDHNVFNNPRKLLKPLRLPKNLSIPERQLKILQHNWLSGKTPLSKVRRFKVKVELLLRTIKGVEINKFKKESGFILVHDESISPDWTRKEKLELLRTEIKMYHFTNTISERVGLDTQIPMTNMEYANITRVKQTSVDDYVDDILNPHRVIDTDTIYDQVTRVLFINSYQRIYDEMSRHVAGYLELGDSFDKSDGSGKIVLPNSNSHFIGKVIDQVSR